MAARQARIEEAQREQLSGAMVEAVKKQRDEDIKLEHK